MSNPELMQQLLESPLMQNVLADPEVLQGMLTSNPQIQQLMEVKTGRKWEREREEGKEVKREREREEGKEVKRERERPWEIKEVWEGNRRGWK